MSAAAGGSLTVHRTWAAWSFFALGVVLVIGWPIAAIVNWDDIVDSHVRLGYLVGDIGLSSRCASRRGTACASIVAGRPGS
jgi:hypothetical protein